MGKAITYHFNSCVGCPVFGTNEHGVLLCWFKGATDRPVVLTEEEVKMLYSQDEYSPAPHWFPEWCPITEGTANIFQEEN